jgi:hypothetical protein
MNNISTRADADKVRWRNLRSILDCLAVRNPDEYAAMRERLAEITAGTRKKRGSFSQLDLRFRDSEGFPIEDYSVILGEIVNGKDKASKTVSDTHKNKVEPSHFTIFIDRSDFEPEHTYFLELDASSGTRLFDYSPDPFRLEFSAATIQAMIAPDQTTQLDVILDRRASSNLFVFHAGDDEELHVEWNRDGDVTRRRRPID